VGAALVLAFAVMLLAAGPASAGRLVATGHDADFHCSLGAQCHFIQTAVNYVRAGAPDPSKPVLVLDRGDLDFVLALDNAFGAGAVPRDVVDPRSGFAGVRLATSRYSAILIASDITCGGCDLNEFDSTPDSDAINARKDAIANFFNDGGGVYANAGASHGDGTASSGPDTYYSFLPIPVGGTPVSGPFCLTPIGAGLGFEDPAGCPDATRHRGTNDDINCCATHNSFLQPSSKSPLDVAETDVGPDGVVGPDDVPQTLVASAVESGGTLEQEADTVNDLPKPTLGRKVNIQELKGRVRVDVAGGARRFVELSKARRLSVGSLIDTREGTVRLQSAANKAGKRKNGDFSGGIFQVKQSRKRSAKGLTDLILQGGSFKNCGARSGRASAALSRRTVRRLRSSARGRHRTSGRHAAATVRGTIWVTEDRCDGTLTRVIRGSVSVRDFVRRRTAIVRAGKRYLAKAPG
jgi:hypothetical protein